MADLNRLEPFALPLTVRGVDVELAGMRRGGTGTPIVFLHGFGSTKEDYADIVHQAALDDRPVLAYDAPGCGATTCADLAAVTIPYLVDVAIAALDAAGIERCDLVGHSMGALTALLLADGHPDRVTSFVNIEGNLAPEDCFLSRQALDHPAADPEEFLRLFADRLWASRYRSSALYAASVRHKVRADVVAPIFTSMVELSDHGHLLDRFLGLACPTLLVYGDQNSSLTYLPTLAAAGVALSPIPRCGHFPMYANAPAMWDAVTAFVTADRAATRRAWN